VNKLKLLIEDREAEEGYLMWDECPKCGSRDMPELVLYNAENRYDTYLDNDGIIIVGEVPRVSCALEDEYLVCRECNLHIELGNYNPVIGGSIGVCITCMDKEEMEERFDVVYLEDNDGKNI